MDEISSSEFRRRYATLTEPTIVTVLGRPIGHWVPADYRPTLTVSVSDHVHVAEGLPRSVTREIPSLADRFNSRGSRPVPKGK